MNAMRMTLLLVVAMIGCAGAALPEDVSIRPGFSVSCDATFPTPPRGMTQVLCKDREYLLRYDRDDDGGRGRFSFWVWLNGGWEPRVSVATNVETGRVYRLVARWDGREISLGVDGEKGVRKHPRRGRCAANPASRLALGTRGRVDVANVEIRNERRNIVEFGTFRTRELMPRVGRAATLRGVLCNIGEAIGECTVTAKARGGVQISPETVSLPGLPSAGETPLEWTVDPGTNGFSFLDFTVRRTGAGTNAATLCRASKRIVFMPDREPARTAKAWNPPIRATRTFHIDADAGDDTRDGLTPKTAWRTFANARGRVLGPGERLLLKRGCVFRDELNVSAAGAADNWAEIGAYGEGGRPQIRRTRHLGESCVRVPSSLPANIDTLDGFVVPMSTRVGALSR